MRACVSGAGVLEDLLHVHMRVQACGHCTCVWVQGAHGGTGRAWLPGEGARMQRNCLPWPLHRGDQDLPLARTSVHPKTHATAAASPGASLSRARAGAVALVKGPAPAPSPSRSGRSPDSLHPRPGPWAASRGPPGLRAPAREQDPGPAQAHFWGALWVPSSPRAAAHAPAATRPGWNSLPGQGHSRSALSSTSPPKTPRPVD